MAGLRGSRPRWGRKRPAMPGASGITSLRGRLGITRSSLAQPTRKVAFSLKLLSGIRAVIFTTQSIRLKFMSRNDNMWRQSISDVRSGRAVRFIVWSVVVAAGMVATFWAQTETGPVVRMGLQKPPKVRFVVELPDGAMRLKATTACTECHEARIILQQRLSKAAWTKEVDKMIKWGAVVDGSDHDALIDYLSTNFGVVQLMRQPP